MLVLTRKEGQGVLIEGKQGEIKVEVHVLRITKNGSVSLGLRAPKQEVSILRLELAEKARDSDREEESSEGHSEEALLHPAMPQKG